MNVGKYLLTHFVHNILSHLLKNPGQGGIQDEPKHQHQKIEGGAGKKTMKVVLPERPDFGAGQTFYDGSGVRIDICVDGITDNNRAGQFYYNGENDQYAGAEHNKNMWF